MTALVSIIQSNMISTVIAPQIARTILSVGQGPAGPSGAAQSPEFFSFGDATPRVVLIPAYDTTIYAVRLVIDVAFDGLGARLQVFTNTDILMDTYQNDPTAVGEYEAGPALNVAGGDNIYLAIIPGAGATQGSGRIIFETVPS